MYLIWNTIGDGDVLRRNISLDVVGQLQLLLSPVREEVNVMTLNILPVSPLLSQVICPLIVEDIWLQHRLTNKVFIWYDLFWLLFIHGKVFYYIFSQIANQKLSSPNFRLNLLKVGWAQRSYLQNLCPSKQMNGGFPFPSVNTTVSSGEFTASIVAIFTFLFLKKESFFFI